MVRIGKRKKKKITKLRGTRYCGHGKSDRTRGKGAHGGKGKAGSKAHRRRQLFGGSGRRGFIPKTSRKQKTINVSQLPALYEAEKQKQLDLSKLGYSKITGAGTINTPINVKISRASQKAVEKIQKAGGKIELPPKTQQPEPQEKPEKKEKNQEKQDPAREKKQKTVDVVEE